MIQWVDQHMIIQLNAFEHFTLTISERSGVLDFCVLLIRKWMEITTSIITVSQEIINNVLIKLRNRLQAVIRSSGGHIKTSDVHIKLLQLGCSALKVFFQTSFGMSYIGDSNAFYIS